MFTTIYRFTTSFKNGDTITRFVSASTLMSASNIALQYAEHIFEPEKKDYYVNWKKDLHVSAVKQVKRVLLANNPKGILITLPY